MATELEGGCRIAGLREGNPVRASGVRIWRHFGRGAGARAVSLRVLEFDPGTSPGVRNGECEEVLYVLTGKGTLFLDGWPHEVSPDTGVFVRPGVGLTVANPGPQSLRMLSAQCPDPGPTARFEAACTTPARESEPAPSPLVRLADRATQSTGDRWYRVLVDERIGCAQVTQFVGSIPPGRAPDHFHHYEEVLCILEGTGRLWAGESAAPLEPGSCVLLPPRAPHCVENTGTGELRLLGVFYPAGSPEARYPVSS